MENLYDIWFADLDIKNQTKLELLNKFSTKEIYDLTYDDFLKIELEEEDTVKIIKAHSLDESKKSIECMKNENIKLISVKDDKYPNKLHNIENKPAFLYIKGNENILDDDSVRYCWL